MLQWLRDLRAGFRMTPGEFNRQARTIDIKISIPYSPANLETLTAKAPTCADAVAAVKLVDASGTPLALDGVQVRVLANPNWRLA
jgi:hypothetical protein